MGALTIAGHYIIPGMFSTSRYESLYNLSSSAECCLYFNHTLFRGNRVTKISSYDLSAFSSLNFPPLVNGMEYLPTVSAIDDLFLVGIDIIVNWNDVLRQTSLRKFRVHKRSFLPLCCFSLVLTYFYFYWLTGMDPHVATLRLFPGISGATIRAFCMAPIRGVVLETFGAGNAPQHADVMDALKGACDRGVVIVAITQCAKGSVSDAYETGRTLLQLGVVPGSDMTPEVRASQEMIDNARSQIISNYQCALAKLSYLLSKSELSINEVRNLIGTPLRGELSRPSGAPVQQPSVEQNMDNIQQLLSQFVRLTRPPSVPTINVISETGQSTVTDATAPWTRTAAEAATTEAVLFPFLVHLAAARDDLESLQFCLKPVDTDDPAEVLKFGMIPGGIVNCLEAGSGRSPLHVAALNGNTKSVELLLRCGALVHLRDTLGHTALYLVSFLAKPTFLA